ncbi:BREX-1 system adenine-specific DNA-methyltransferase PglX [Nostoc sp.]|uniref:BREX-1 system adenine-specific DNA-methyltransferase PglX n=1 Tax=Nostoc sp. TaxID=1180 RepID=UPI002FF6243C
MKNYQFSITSMNRTAIKNFAIWARRYLREQVKARAAQYGITDKSIIQSQAVTGGLLVAGQTLNAIEANQYEQLRNHLQDLTLTSSQPQAVDALIDEIAYTWFNRLAALRFMEVNGYIGRVLSSSDSNLVDPDLLRDASSIAEMGDLPGLDLDTLNEWRSFANHDPNPDEFLYRRLLLAQCKALAEGIPALFDPRQNYQALFLPGNLLNQDSIVRRLVKEIPEEDWQNIEVVGWLYQFYISERKDEVIGAKSKVAAADIPALILTHNLYGLDIDERAAQLASFAVLMKARAKNSRILRKSLALNIMAVRPTHSQTLPPATELNTEDWQPLIEAFKDADNLGSLITPPAFDSEKLKWQLNNLEASDSLFRECVPALQALLLQAELLRNKYWVVVANPPYMGSKSLNDILRSFANQNYPDSKSDAFSIFIERFLNMSLQNGFIGFMTPFTWMYLSSYKKLRRRILSENTITSLIRPEYHAFFDSAFVPICAFTLLNKALPEYQGTFIDLNKFYGADLQPIKVLEAIKNPNCGYLYYAKAADFAKIPGSAIAYWATQKILNIFENSLPLGNIANPVVGLQTGNNERFLRRWFEIACQNIDFGISNQKKSEERWFPYNKDGEFKKWYGNQEWVVNWENNGFEIKIFGTETGGKLRSRPQNTNTYFKESISWSKVTMGSFCLRYFPQGFIYDVAGCSIFAQNNATLKIIAGILNSKLSKPILAEFASTLNYEVGQVSKVPIIKEWERYIEVAENLSDKCINISKFDWDNFETSWDFQTHPLLRHNTKHLSEAFNIWQSKSETAFRELQQLEEENNRYWIEAYGLQDELTPEVPDDQITIRRADLNKDIRSLISYAVGCIMGRYSLDKPGLIHAGQPFDPTLHQTLSASSDAIIPITDQAYFDNDIVTRFIEFLRIAYSPETLSENLNFIANALTLKNGESAQERIRRYFLQEFISDHIQTYKKRPIYWLFTSGKKRAFGALLYLHRYSEDALARIRTDYVLELQVKLDGEIARAQQQLDNTTSSAAKKAATNRLKELQAQQLELRDYQAKLQTQADARINLDLDDGVAYNYTRFKGLVYEGADLKIADLEKASQWKRELLK